MPTYIVLLKYKPKELAAVFGNPARIAAERATFKAMGVEIKSYVTIDRYDLVLLIDAPDDDLYNRVMLSFGERVSTVTMKPLSQDQIRKIIAAL